MAFIVLQFTDGKSICEGRAKLDEKFNFDRTKQIAFSDC